MTPGVIEPDFLALVGLKGAGAPGLIESLGFVAPSRPNTWTALPGSGWCLRQGRTEYLLASPDGQLATRCHAVATTGPLPVHLLLRQDRCVVLQGPRATARLLSVCDIDERVFEREPDALALLQVAGVSACLQRPANDATGAVYRIWLDPTYLDHVLETLARHAAHES